PRCLQPSLPPATSRENLHSDPTRLPANSLRALPEEFRQLQIRNSPRRSSRSLPESQCHQVAAEFQPGQMASQAVFRRAPRDGLSLQEVVELVDAGCRLRIVSTEQLHPQAVPSRSPPSCKERREITLGRLQQWSIESQSTIKFQFGFAGL